MSDSPTFPFSAIVDQERMKDALLCNAVHPEIGGVLISGTRGTAKSTAARSLAGLLPQIRVVADCPYNCPPDNSMVQCERCADREFDDRPELVETIPTPFVNLPIGATEDRVLGTIDLESAIQEGERSFEPGLLARANRGILYVDEVNLLGDHLVDVLLDAVAMGTNRVEREGISFEHPANVMLIGTMNPEEGELRPQLLDRFGLFVDMDRDMAPADRKAVVRRRTTFDADPQGMVETWSEEEQALAERISAARAAFSDVQVGEPMLDRIVQICVDHDVDGLRADIIIHRTARALAALDGATEVADSHVSRAAELALGHRSRSNVSPNPSDPDPDPESDRQADEPPEKPPPPDLRDLDGPSEEPAAGESSSGNAETDGDEPDAQGESGAGDDQVYPIAPGRKPPRPNPNRRIDLPELTGQGGRTRARTTNRRGAYYRAGRPNGPPSDLALDATVRAAAPYQHSRTNATADGLAVRLRPADLRVKRRESRVRNLVVFVVDSSGSMGAYERMSAVKGAILSLLEDAYQQRDYVSLVGFRKNRAETLLPPTSSVPRAARQLAEMPTGGRTPLATGLKRGLELVERERGKQSNLLPFMVVITDGRSNYTDTEASPVEDALQWAGRIRRADVPAVCFDTETGPVRMGLVRTLAERMGAAYHRFDDFGSGEISATVRDVFYGSRSPGS